MLRIPYHNVLRIVRQIFSLVVASTAMASIAIPQTMFAWQYANFPSNGLENHLTFQRSVSTPTLGHFTSGSLIRVLAAALNPADYKLAELPVLGRLFAASPASPARDFVGRIVATNDIPGLAPGDLVVGSVWIGALAQYVLASRRDAVAKVPDALAAAAADQPRKFAELATFGVAGLTALASVAYLPPGGSVFINGGSGGCGTFAVQIARIVGAGRVVASCSPGNAELVRGLGADAVVDYTRGDLDSALAALTQEDGEQGKFDLVVDNAGKDLGLYYQAHEFLKPDGRYILVGVPVIWGLVPTLLKMFFLPRFLGGGRRKIELCAGEPKREDLEKLMGWVADGRLNVVVDEVFTRDDVPAAFRKLKARHTRGKIVVLMELI